ncbi:hypothetical protein WBG78_04950 [Chryseolinea sp. T2]|uniref:hypothetical protein n=1 Tax=Chryseolinea sp. T2 TaxID=3129255 RepID=UPI0030778524
MKLLLLFATSVLLFPFALNAQQNSIKFSRDSLSILLLDDTLSTAYLSEVFRNHQSTKVLNIEIAEEGWVGYGYMEGVVSKVSVGQHIEIPETIGLMTGLTSLSLPGLGLKQLPQSLFTLPHLETLDISFNDLDLWAEVEKLANLKKLRTLKAYGASMSEGEYLKSSFPQTRILFRQR